MTGQDFAPHQAKIERDGLLENISTQLRLAEQQIAGAQKIKNDLSADAFKKRLGAAQGHVETAMLFVGRLVG